MFSLIISIIAIALVAALALASIYYGGDAFQEGTSKAEAATIVNQGQQVQGAFTMAEINGAVNPTIDDLKNGNFLKEVPQVRGAAWTISGTNALLTVATDEVCSQVEMLFDGLDDATAVGEQTFGCFNKTAYYTL